MVEATMKDMETGKIVRIAMTDEDIELQMFHR